MANKKLNPDDKQFFSLVSQATFANPFSKKRYEIDKQITKQSGKSWMEIMPEVIKQVRNKIDSLNAGSPAVISNYQKEEQVIIRHAFLFEAFHQLTDHFDKLIEEQSKSDKPIEVPFAKKAIDNLKSRGFTQAEATKFFAMFYQLRRAFYFIHRGLIGKSVSMEKLRMNLWNNIFTYDIFQYESYLWDKMEDFSTLLLGPTGCGKGTAAAAIGQSGFIPFDQKNNCFAESFTKSFVPINLSQFAESLLESELFGHSKGAFTGAVNDHEGIFEMCNRYGSIFLDEIGEISLPIQIKLLRVLQERIFTPVGSHKNKAFEGRVIAATNQSIQQLRQTGKFRDDFYYRLCSDCIEVPSLQIRINENPRELNELVIKTVERITGSQSDELISNVLDVIDKQLGKNYHWPGNVRELEQCVRRVIIKRDYQGDSIQQTQQSDNFIDNIQRGQLDAKDLLSGYCKLLYDKYGTFEQVARQTGLDRRTAKKHIES